MSTCCLQSIKICSFKSYKGLVEICDFKPFTAIIGPNGCGKSNFMDAVGFALGESYKAFRLNNWSELIHGAMTENPVFDPCYVTLMFLLEDGRTKSFRRTFIGTSRRSRFEINETVVSSEVYQAELNRIGICDRGRNCLIFQSNVESIAIKDSKETCAFFERLSGSVQFQKEYLASKEEMEKAQGKVKYTFEEMKILDMEVKVISSEKKNALIFADLEKKEMNLIRDLQLLNLFHIEKDIEKANNTYQKTLRKIEILKKAGSEGKDRRDELKEVIRNMKLIEIQMNETIAKQETELDLQKMNVIQKQNKITYLDKKEERISKSLAAAENKRESHKNNIQDLKKTVESELAAYHQDSASNSDSQDSPRSLDEEQFHEYSKLKLDAGKQTSVYTQELESKMRELQKDKDRLDNETRKMMEINTNIQLTEKHLKKVQEREDSLKKQLDANNRLLMEKESLRDTLVMEIAEAQKILPKLENEKAQIIETLKNAKDDKYSQQKAERKAKCVKQLRDNFPGVIGRLSDLCRPKHSRYNIAFIKIFGKHADSIVIKDAKTAKGCIQFLKDHKLDREMFIPLDNIDPQPIKESHRNIKDPPNVKLGYDVIEFPPEIDLAVRFVTKNMLICETMRDARQLSGSHETESGRKLGHTCVSLNGTMFQKYGMISGGQSDLARQAQMWNDKEIMQMKLRKPTVEKEIKAALQKIHEKSTVELLNSKIDGLRKCNTYIQHHLDSVVNEQKVIDGKLRDLNAKEEEISKTIQEINNIISAKEEVMNDIKKKIGDVEDEVFRNFCEKIGYTNIREYEGKDFRKYQQKRQRIQQLRDQLNRINYFLELEGNLDDIGKISKWNECLTQTQAELKNETEKLSTILEEIKKMEEKLQNERSSLELKRAEIEEATKEFRDYDKVIRDNMKEIDSLTKNIEEHKTNCNTKRMEILRTCQIREIQIPLRSGNLNSFDLSEEGNQEVIEMDYSNLPEAYQEREIIKENEVYLKSEIDKIQGHLDRIEAPNKKAEKRLKALKEQRRRIQQKLQEEQVKAKHAQTRFETVMRKRSTMFNSFMTKVSNVIDDIYKRLTKNDSAQAFLNAENYEEPYLDGIIYICIPPGKKSLTMDALSGGEKSIAALALLFAIQKAKPAPFFLLDEVDAALDSVNIRKVADFIRDEKQSLQFIIISLKLKLYSKADALVGITANEGELVRSCSYFLDLQTYQ